MRYLAATVVLALLSAGCRTGTAPEVPGTGGSVGADAAEIERAKAKAVQDEIELLERQRRRLAERRDALLRDADDYRTRAARAWTDIRLSDRERAAYAKQYASLAEERARQADRCEQLISTYDARISLLKAKQRELLKRADRFEAMATERE